MIAIDSSGWLATTSEIFLIEEAFTWPEMRATSMPASRRSGVGNVEAHGLAA